jgi:flagellar protein FliT
VNSADLLKRYDELLRLSQQMLAVARQSDWDRLVEIEKLRAVIADSLVKQDSEILWDASDAARKAQTIHAVLDADAEIKSLTALWMGELQALLGSIGSEKKLQKAYEIP